VVNFGREAPEIDHKFPYLPSPASEGGVGGGSKNKKIFVPQLNAELPKLPARFFVV
jgi:hypothetical protein